MIVVEYNKSPAHSRGSIQVQVKRASSARKATCRTKRLATENTQGLLLEAWKNHDVQTSSIHSGCRYSRCFKISLGCPPLR